MFKQPRWTFVDETRSVAARGDSEARRSSLGYLSLLSFAFIVAFAVTYIYA